MSSQNTFPWDTLKAETLRSIVHDLGIPVARSLRKREGMIKVLISVTEKGCKSRLENTTRLVDSERLLMPSVSSREDNRGISGDCQQGAS